MGATEAFGEVCEAKGLEQLLTILKLLFSRLFFSFDLHIVFQAPEVRQCVEEIVFSYTYPRLDMEVCGSFLRHMVFDGIICPII